MSCLPCPTPLRVSPDIGMGWFKGDQKWGKEEKQGGRWKENVPGPAGLVRSEPTEGLRRPSARPTSPSPSPVFAEPELSANPNLQRKMRQWATSPDRPTPLPVPAPPRRGAAPSPAACSLSLRRTEPPETLSGEGEREGGRSPPLCLPHPGAEPSQAPPRAGGQPGQPAGSPSQALGRGYPRPPALPAWCKLRAGCRRGPLRVNWASSGGAKRKPSLPPLHRPVAAGRGSSPLTLSPKVKSVLNCKASTSLADPGELISKISTVLEQNVRAVVLDYQSSKNTAWWYSLVLNMLQQDHFADAGIEKIQPLWENKEDAVCMAIHRPFSSKAETRSLSHTNAIRLSVRWKKKKSNTNGIKCLCQNNTWMLSHCVSILTCNEHFCYKVSCVYLGKH